MLSDKNKRNLWLVLSVLSVGIIADRTVRMVDGLIGWWEVCSSVVITFFCVKNFLCYHRQMKGSNR